VITNVFQENVLRNAVGNVERVAEYLSSLVDAQILGMIVIEVEGVLGEDLSSLVYLFEN